MNKQRLAQRAAGVTLAAALGLGVAGPAASAGTTAQTARNAVHVAVAQQPATEYRSTFQIGQVSLNDRLSASQTAELQQNSMRGVPPWLKWVLKKLGAKKVKKLTQAAVKGGWKGFKKAWNSTAAWYIKRVVGTGAKLYQLYLFFKGLG